MGLMLFCVPLVIITFLLLIIGILFYVSLKKAAQERAWAKLASQNTLLFERAIFSKNLRVRGKYRGHEILFDTYSTTTTGFQTGSHSFPHTSFQITFTNQYYVYLFISDKCLYALRFDSSVIPTGDVYLDQRFAISSHPKELALDIFSDDPLRSKLLQARPFSLEINGSRLILQQRGIEKDASYLH